MIKQTTDNDNKKYILMYLKQLTSKIKKCKDLEADVNINYERDRNNEMKTIKEIWDIKLSFKPKEK